MYVTYHTDIEVFFFFFGLLCCVGRIYRDSSVTGVYSLFILLPRLLTDVVANSGDGMCLVIII